MPSVGHFAVALAGGRVARPAGRARRAVWLAALVAVSLAPDLDVVAFRLGIPYGAPFGHRGAAHSIVVGVVLGLAVGLVGWRLGMRLGPAMAAAVVVSMSHGILDTFTNGGRGIALLWPFSNARLFAPWRPIPVAPIGLAFFSPRGVAVMLHELLLFAPLFAIALWPSRHKRRGVAPHRRNASRSGHGLRARAPRQRSEWRSASADYDDGHLMSWRGEPWW